MMTVKTYKHVKRRGRLRCLTAHSEHIDPKIERCHGHVVAEFKPNNKPFKLAELRFTRESWASFKSRVDQEFEGMK